MFTISSFRERLFFINQESFEAFAIEVFRWQAAENALYKEYLSNLNINPLGVKRLEDIPFLPIAFFKDHIIKTGEWPAALTFLSSGTTGSHQSRHSIDAPWFYEQITRKIFEELYGPLHQCHFLALLPSYLEREGSSLIHMVRHFIEASGSPLSGFYLNNEKEFLLAVSSLQGQQGRKILWGVTFALLDLAEKHALDLSDFIVMETGGMKGRRNEMVREEVHEFLQERFNVRHIHSEYGMTELISQAYALEKGRFSTPAWMRVLIRDVNDPFTILPVGRTGGINVIDLGNLHSCCFVETADLGKNVGPDHQFEVLGRFDNSDVRGCNLLIQ